MIKAQKASDIDLILGRKLHSVRKKQKLSLETVSAGSGITAHQLSKYEKGRNRLSLGRLSMIAKALGVPIKDIMQEIELQAEEIEPVTTLDQMHREFTANIYVLVRQFPALVVPLNRFIASFDRITDNE